MCGITLIIDKTFKLSDQLIQKANQTLKHRGPDVQQWKSVDFSWARIWMGHTRLSLLDLTSGSNQPMQQGEHSLLFNGEVYNFKELVPGAASDTQTIFRQLQAHGITDIVHRWTGMYALAWIDRKLERIQLLRDPQGIKPLYKFESEKVSIYTSELKVLKALGYAEEEFQREHIQHYLTFKYFPSGTTPYKNVQALKPGILYQCDKSGVQEKNIPFPQHQIEKTGNLILDIETLLFESIQKHAIADVPVGIFLSGGIDSSLLAHLASYKGMRLPSYSVAFQGVNASQRTLDAEYSEKVAQRCGLPWRCLSLTENDFWNSDDWIQSMDMPVGDSAAWLTYRLSSFAKKEVKAVWSGAGADELFAGYNRHKAFRFYLKYGKQKFLFKSGKALTQILPDSNKKFRMYKKFFAGVSEDPTQTWNDFCSLKLPLKQKSLPRRKILDLKSALLDDERNYLVNDVLSITDMMSMAHSLEVRVPYLYQPLMRRIHGASEEELMRKGGKWILKEILKKHKGSYLLKRPKEGFGAPVNLWMKGERGKEWINTIDEKHWISQYLDMSKWQENKKMFLAGDLDLSQELITLYVLDKFKAKS